MGRLRRLLDRFRQSDEERLADEVRSWAESIPGASAIAECARRQPVRIAGVVRRLTVRPTAGMESLEARVTDGTGEVVVQWMGRNHIPGLALGRRLVLEGVIGPQREGLRMVNPRFEFA